MNLGINLSGSEYGLLATTASVDYFAAKGFSTIRLPVTWEQLQASLYSPLNASLVTELHTFVSYAEQQGMQVILDVHSYGAFNGSLIGSTATPTSAFADLWGKLAGEFAHDSNVSFGLMNEPQLDSASLWLPAVNEAIAAIRGAGATGQQILISGAYWDGGQSWTTTDNASVLGAPGAIVDPSHKFTFEVHQYLDDTSGQHDWVVSETIGVERLEAVTTWARETGAKLYLGEFGVADNPTSLAALSNMLNFVEQNSDVWQGAAYWAAGVGWQDYMYSVEPNLGVLDMPQMAVLENYASTKVVSTALQDGGVELDTFVSGGDAPTIKDVLDATGHLTSRTLFDADGHVTRSVNVSQDGQYELSIYAGASDAPSTVEIYDASYDLISRTTLQGDGSKIVTFYGESQWDVTRSETYASDGSLASVEKSSVDGGHNVETYLHGVISQEEVYDASWRFVSRANYDASGHLTKFQSTDAAGDNIVNHYIGADAQISESLTYDSDWRLVSKKDYDPDGALHSVQTTLLNDAHLVESYVDGKVVKADTYNSSWTLVSSTADKADGTHVTDIYANWRIVESQSYGADGKLISQTSYNASGGVTSILRQDADGSHQVATFDHPGAADPSLIDTFDSSGHLTSRVRLDASGHVSTIEHAGADGTHVIDSFQNGSSLASNSETYDANWALLTRSTFDVSGKIVQFQEDRADGTHTIATFDTPGAEQPRTIDVSDASWRLTERAHLDASGTLTSIDHVNADGSHRIDQFGQDTTHPPTSEFYDAAWGLVSETTFDVNGLVASIRHERTDGSHAIATFATSGATYPASSTFSIHRGASVSAFSSTPKVS